MRAPILARALPALAVAAALALVAHPARATESKTLQSLMPDYDAARGALANDQLGELPAPAKRLQRAIAAIKTEELTAEDAGVAQDQLGQVRELLPELRQAADALASASSLAEARKAFGDLSKGLIAWRKLAGSGPDVGFCPMAGKSWLQAPGTPAENPYSGRAMATCGEVGPPGR